MIAHTTSSLRSSLAFRGIGILTTSAYQLYVLDLSMPRRDRVIVGWRKRGWHAINRIAKDVFIHALTSYHIILLILLIDQKSDLIQLPMSQLSSRKASHAGIHSFMQHPSDCTHLVYKAFSRRFWLAKADGRSFVCLCVSCQPLVIFFVCDI